MKKYVFILALLISKPLCADVGGIRFAGKTLGYSGIPSPGLQFYLNLSSHLQFDVNIYYLLLEGGADTGFKYLFNSDHNDSWHVAVRSGLDFSIATGAYYRALYIGKSVGPWVYEAGPAYFYRRAYDQNPVWGAVAAVAKEIY